MFPVLTDDHLFQFPRTKSDIASSLFVASAKAYHYPRHISKVGGGGGGEERIKEAQLKRVFPFLPSPRSIHCAVCISRFKNL